MSVDILSSGLPSISPCHPIDATIDTFLNTTIDTQSTSHLDALSTRLRRHHNIPHPSHLSDCVDTTVATSKNDTLNYTLRRLSLSPLTITHVRFHTHLTRSQMSISAVIMTPHDGRPVGVDCEDAKNNHLTFR